MHHWMVIIYAKLVFAIDNLQQPGNFGYPLPVPDTRVFGNSSTRYPGIKIGGYLQSLVLTKPIRNPDTPSVQLPGYLF